VKARPTIACAACVAALVALAVAPPEPRAGGTLDPAIVLRPDTVAHDTVLVGEASVRHLEVWNAGASDLVVDEVFSDDASLLVTPAAFLVPPGGHQLVRVEWTPTSPARLDALMYVTSNDPARLTTTARVTGRSTLDPAGVTGGPGIDRLTLSLAGRNPARGRVAMELWVPSPATIDVAVFDAQGGRVRYLARRDYEPGRHSIVWDGRNVEGRQVHAGVYFVHAASRAGKSTIRFVIAR
jgi:hypothetical protein